MRRVTRWTGRMLSVAGLGAWLIWFAWRVTSPIGGVTGTATLVLELLAFAAATAFTVGLWSWDDFAVDPFDPADGHVDGGLLAVGLGLGDRTNGADDTGEVACARQGLVRLHPRRVEWVGRHSREQLAWTVLAVEGIRRMAFVVVLVAVLLSGRFPFPVPAPELVFVLLGAHACLALGHSLQTGGALRPGERARWSMMTVGAGIGDGVSRTGLPIRWATTMGTVIVLNLAVSLRGFSDRWTHGLGALEHGERVIAMSASWWLVVVGFFALRALPQPVLGSFEPSRRLEETSTRRLALGGTLLVALVGYVAGALPGTVPV